VIVIEYSVFVVVGLVVIVAVALPGGANAVGLRVHTGGSVVAIVDVIVQLSVTVPV
jgi:hypothetical protein